MMTESNPPHLHQRIKSRSRSHSSKQKCGKWGSPQSQSKSDKCKHHWWSSSRSHSKSQISRRSRLRGSRSSCRRSRSRLRSKGKSKHSHQSESHSPSRKTSSQCHDNLPHQSTASQMFSLSWFKKRPLTYSNLAAPSTSNFVAKPEKSLILDALEFNSEGIHFQETGPLPNL